MKKFLVLFLIMFSMSAFGADQVVTITIPSDKVAVAVEGFLAIYPNMEVVDPVTEGSPLKYTTAEWIREKTRRAFVATVNRGLQKKASEAARVASDDGVAECVLCRFLERRFEKLPAAAEASQRGVRDDTADADRRYRGLARESIELAAVFVAAGKVGEQVAGGFEPGFCESRAFPARKRGNFREGGVEIDRGFYCRGLFCHGRR